MTMNNNEIYHYGVPGMRWGVRKSNMKGWSNDAVTAARIKTKKVNQMSNKELSTLNARQSLEKKHSDLNPSAIKKGIAIAGATAAAIGTGVTLYKYGKQAVNKGKEIVKKNKDKKVAKAKENEKTTKDKKTTEQDTQPKNNSSKKGLIIAGAALAIIGSIAISRYLNKSSNATSSVGKKVSTGKKILEKQKDTNVADLLTKTSTTKPVSKAEKYVNRTNKMTKWTNIMSQIHF